MPSCQPFAASPETPSVRRRQYNSSMQVELTRAGKACTLGDGSLTLGAQRLQGLFHSLSKVLFIFRSHYLFAIGLGAIFSLRRSTPPVCTALSNCATREIFAIWQGAHRTNGTVALHGVTFQSASPGCTYLAKTLALQFHGFRFLQTADSSIGFSLFTRRYSGNHSCFLVLR